MFKKKKYENCIELHLYGTPKLNRYVTKVKQDSNILLYDKNCIATKQQVATICRVRNATLLESDTDVEVEAHLLYQKGLPVRGNFMDYYDQIIYYLRGVLIEKEKQVKSFSINKRLTEVGEIVGIYINVRW